MMILIVTIIFFFSEISKRSYGNCVPAFSQKVLPAPVVCAALHHRHRNPWAENPLFLQLSARWRWRHCKYTHVSFYYQQHLKCLLFQERLEPVRSFWFNTTNSSYIGCFPSVKTKVSPSLFKCRDFTYSESDIIWYLFCRRGKRGAQSDPELLSNWRKEGI